MFIHRLSQSGVSILDTVLLALAFAVIAFIGIRIYPSVSEYRAVQAIADSVSHGNESAAAIRLRFDQELVDHRITVLNSSNIDVARAASSTFAITFKYEKTVKLVGPVSLSIVYEGVAGKT